MVIEPTLLTIIVGSASVSVALFALVIGINRLTLQFTAMRKSELDKQIGEVLRSVLEANRLILNGGIAARERVKLLKEQIRVYLAVWEDDPFLLGKTPHLLAAYSMLPGEEIRKEIIAHCKDHEHDPASIEFGKCKHHTHQEDDYTEPVILPEKKKKKKKKLETTTSSIPIVVAEPEPELTLEPTKPSILDCCTPTGNQLVKYAIEEELVELLKSLKYANHRELKLSDKKLRFY